jgi:phage shock protein PspC (stress-responsive transcriptional regulator)
MAEKKIAGVCSGIARYYGWDVTLVRVAFLTLVVFKGVGLLAYLIAWVCMPRDDRQFVST